MDDTGVNIRLENGLKREPDIRTKPINLQIKSIMENNRRRNDFTS